MSSPYRLDHLAVHARGIDASLHFYTHVLGLVEVANPMGAGFFRWLALDDRVMLHLVPGAREENRERTIQTHVALAVADFEATVARLTKASARFGELPSPPGRISTRPDGVRQCFVCDPDGYWIEVNDAVSRG